ncbi:MAG TPA: DUF1302 family protein [Polyangiaceae bacterium]|nr:DUF1302 family protein [Polyangiaceae bacterium]
MSSSSAVFAQEEAAASESVAEEGTEQASAEATLDAAPSTDAAASAESTPSEPAAEDDGTVVESGGGLFESATSASEETTGGDSGVSVEWGGYVRGDVFIGTIPKAVDPDKRQVGVNAAYGEFAFQPRVKAGSWGGAFADLRFRYGQQLDEFKLWVDPREVYASAYLGPFELRLGKQVIVWGRADGFNPTSNIAAVDFRIRSPIEDDRRIGSVGARAFLTFNPIKLEAVWVPLYEPTMYPTFEIDDTVTSFVDPNYPSVSMADSLYAGRVHLELSAFDASVSYLHGYAPLPGVELESYQVGSESTGGSERGYIHVRRRAYLQHVFGADFATAVSDWFGLRGEGAYRLPVECKTGPCSFAAKPDIQWVLGIDREFGPVSIIAQYLGKYTFDWEEKHPVDDRGADGILALNPNNPDDVADADAAIRNSIFNTNQMLFNQLYQLQSLASVRLEWKTMHETLSISALGLYNFNTHEWLVSPKLGYAFGNGLNAYVGAEIYSGPSGTLIDLIDEKLSSGYMELRASF